MSELKIALLGAPQTGKSRLAASLHSALAASGMRAEVVIADPPALDASANLTLLMGLETPINIHGSGKNANPRTPPLSRMQQVADGSIRAALAASQVPYQVLYGSAVARLDQSVKAAQGLVQAQDNCRIPTARAASNAQAWRWPCEKCSEPQCEQRLLTDLLAQRAIAA